MQLLQGMVLMVSIEILQVIAMMNVLWCVYMDLFVLHVGVSGREGSVGGENTTWVVLSPAG